MIRRLLYTALLLWVCASAFSRQTLRIMSYNVENLFYPEADSLHPDTEFTPEGARHWSVTRYRRKLAHIAQVMADAGQWEMPAIVGLQEVEEERCLSDLCTYHLRSHRYRYVLFEGPDVRGIDVGLIYDTTQVTLQYAAPVPVPLPAGERPTRDILYTRFLLCDSTCLHVFTCHLPSQVGGAKASEHRRKAVADVLSHQADSLLQADSLAYIVMMGDFNADPQDNMPPMINLMLPMTGADRGTEKYHGHWAFLDQFFVSPAMSEAKAQVFDADFLLESDKAYLGMKPRRTYHGYHYQRDGYSDHLPVLLEWIIN